MRNSGKQEPASSRAKLGRLAVLGLAMLVTILAAVAGTSKIWLRLKASNAAPPSAHVHPSAVPRQVMSPLLQHEKEALRPLDPEPVAESEGLVSGAARSEAATRHLRQRSGQRRVSAASSGLAQSPATPTEAASPARKPQVRVIEAHAPRVQVVD